MSSPVDSDRAMSFGSVADAYERARPLYPGEAVSWLVGESAARVLDLGAGTGKLTRALIAAGHDVVAVEPSEPMLGRLRDALPAVDARLGAAESIPASDASFDVVVVAQAFHWFDRDVAVPEIARVLRPGGRLALIWNLRDEAERWVHELWSVIAPDEPRLIMSADLPSGSPFGPWEQRTFRHSQAVDRDAVLELALSRSYVASKPADRRAELLEQAGRTFDAHAGADAVLPYITHCYRAERMARRSARVLVMDPAGRVLMLNFDDGSGRSLWLAPGGGVEPGESLPVAAVRELYEATGLRVDSAALGPPVAYCTGSADLGWAKGLFRDDYFVHRTPVFEVSTANMTELERQDLADVRWWTADELAASSERIVPPGLAQLVRDLEAGRRPAAPRELLRST